MTKIIIKREKKKDEWTLNGMTLRDLIMETAVENDVDRVMHWCINWLRMEEAWPFDFNYGYGIEEERFEYFGKIVQAVLEKAGY